MTKVAYLNFLLHLLHCYTCSLASLVHLRVCHGLVILHLDQGNAHNLPLLRIKIEIKTLVLFFTEAKNTSKCSYCTQLRMIKDDQTVKIMSKSNTPGALLF